MEHEKSRRSRRAGMTDISGELFRDERPQPDRGGPVKTVALVVVSSLVAIAATWFFLRPAERHGDARPHPVSTPPAMVSVSPAPAPTVRPAALQPSPAAVSPSPAAGQQKPAIVRVVPRAPVSIPSDGNRDGEDPHRAVRKRQAIQPVPEPPPVAASPGVSPDIKVSGIAWQDDRRARRAVVNGFLMKEGGVVAGARIVEILQDRVRFSQAGRDFELSLVVSGSAGATK